MKKIENNEESNGLPLPEFSSSDLRGRQSVRATFKLSEKAIEALSIVSVHLGVKQKSLFDHLLEDIESLGRIAQELEAFDFNRLNRVQKTYVLSRKTLTCIEQTARDFEAPRDALVEYSIQRLLPVIRKERDKHLKRKELLDDLTVYLQYGEKLLAKSEKMLGNDDPVFDHIKTAMTTLVTAYRQIESYVEKGKIIEDF